jgi:hypothetical protein
LTEEKSRTGKHDIRDGPRPENPRNLSSPMMGYETSASNSAPASPTKRNGLFSQIVAQDCAAVLRANSG